MNYEALRRDLRAAGFEPDDELSLWSRHDPRGYFVVEFRTVTAQRTMDLLHAAGVEISPEAHAELWRRESRAVEKPQPDPHLMDKARALVASYRAKIGWRLGTDMIPHMKTSAQCRLLVEAYDALVGMGVASPEARKLLCASYNAIHHLRGRLQAEAQRLTPHRLATRDGDL